MKTLLLFFVFSLGTLIVKSQDLSGLWQGYYDGDGGGSIDLYFYPLSDTSYEIYTFTLMGIGNIDTIVTKAKGFMPSKDSLILEETRTSNMNNVDTCTFQRMELKLVIRKKQMIFNGKWMLIGNCPKVGGKIYFRKKVEKNSNE
jgi:hypothetical protein